MSVEKSSRFWNVNEQTPSNHQLPKKQTGYLPPHCSHCTSFKTQQEDRGVGCFLFKQCALAVRDSRSWMNHKISISNCLSWMICKFLSLWIQGLRERAMWSSFQLYASHGFVHSLVLVTSNQICKRQTHHRYIVQTVSQRTLKILYTQNSFMS